MPQGPGSTSHISILKRAVILALNWHVGLSFNTIAAKINVNEWTARRVVEQAKVVTYLTQSQLLVSYCN
ncbi:hypothetical protein L873DRAFT_1811090 [Choiromyces venosus 120613-1]|uniref:Uncharacterized protein n=1 Tax=Choiromyces venosus 120613-1 TaxID=1336337 RepID=A0A3N4JSI2_9PEZI|nr:hypothetical protein L873DRAFT_1811090 [Choiromyces venosus 120613-1]